MSDPNPVKKTELAVGRMRRKHTKRQMLQALERAHELKRLHELRKALISERESPVQADGYVPGVKEMLSYIDDTLSLPAEPKPESAALPPSTLLLDICLSPPIAHDAVANLQDVFPLWCDRYGIRRARWIFRLQTIFIVVGNRGGALLSFFERVAKLARLTG